MIGFSVLFTSMKPVGVDFTAAKSKVHKDFDAIDLDEWWKAKGVDNIEAVREESLTVNRE